MKSVERDSPIPLYHQLKQLLEGRIASGEFRPGDMLPTEEQLQEQYQLSRITVRQALKELAYEGKVSRHRGRGTIVSQPKLSHSPEPLLSLTDALLQQGIQPSWRVLEADWVPAPEKVAARLGLEAGTPIYCLKRLRLANREPIGYHIAYAVPELTEIIDESLLDSGGSLDYLRASDALTDSYANRTLEAIAATAEVAQLLNIDEGEPLLLINRQVLNRSGRVVEDLRAMYRGDRLQYHIRQGPEVKQG